MFLGKQPQEEIGFLTDSNCQQENSNHMAPD